MKVYTERPLRGNARKAWDYFTKQHGKSPLELFCSRDNDDSPRWMAYYGSGGSYGATHHIYYDIETSSLLRLIESA